MSVPLTDPQTGYPDPYIDLVAAMPGWAKGMQRMASRQQNVFALPVAGEPPLVVFVQEVHNN